MTGKRVVAVLESMWDWRSMTSEAGYTSAPPWFRINPQNKSGKMLYRLVGPDTHLLVTNACRELVPSAAHHGRPDPVWLGRNLRRLEAGGHMDLLLVCGNVAQATYAQSGVRPRCPVLQILHPAARTWSRGMIASTAAAIARLLEPEVCPTPCT